MDAAEYKHVVLGQIINLVSDIALGSSADRAKDTLGRVYDPCCGSGGMFVQSEKFVEAHAGTIGDISVYGQESNYTTWRLAKMNLAIRGIDAQIGHGDTFHHDAHPDLKADCVLANPPFNDSDWRGELLKGDKRWVYGAPPAGNANFAWVQHFIHHLAPAGIAGFVLANGSMSSNQSGEGEIRKEIIEADLVDCMVAMPGQLFYSTPIPVCLWFLTRDKHARKGPDTRKKGTDRSEAGSVPFRRDRRGETLFIDARKHGYVLTPGRYVGAEAVEDDGEPFTEKMKRLTTTLEGQFEESRRLEKEIRKNLKGLGYGE